MKKITFLFVLMFSSFAQNPVITGYIDSTCPNADGRTLELYVEGSVDFTEWNIGRQCDGSGFITNIDISALGTVSDDFVYITNDETILLQEFGVSANVLVNGSINSNGNGGFQIINPEDVVIDRFGKEGIDGSNTVWNHLDSFAYRINGATPNAGNFNPLNWLFGGVDLLDGKGLCNGGDGFDTVVPFGTFSSTGSGNASIVASPDVSSLFYFEGNFDPINVEGSFTVQGLNLTENITVTSSANFELSLTSQDTFSNSLTLIQTSEEVPATEIFVRLQTGLSVGFYDGNITAVADGVTENVNVNGEVFATTPQLDVQTGDILGLDYDLGKGPSQEESLVVEGQFLIDDINIFTSGNFEVSLSSGSGFTTSVDILQASGHASATVYVKLASGLAEGPYSGNLEVSSANVTSQTIILSGNVLGELTSDMVITGVFDGPLTGGTPKVIELYVIRDITDLNVFGVGNANNGGGSDGQEFTFPNVTASVGDYIYIASELPDFNTFFGFDPDYSSSVANINGDDAIELFQNGEVIDTFGDINTDGTDEVWEYKDGWAYRQDNSGPDGGTFVVNNWEFSGTGENDDDTSQGAATNPWPIGTFTTTLGLNNFDPAGIIIYPNPVSKGVLTVESSISDAFEVQLFNMLGQRVLTSKASGSINVSNLNAGVYLIKVILGASFVTKKIVIN